MSSNFEDRPAERQKMTFKTYREFARKRWDENSLPEGTYARRNVYNNFALLLADQCPWHLVLRTKNGEKMYFGPLFIQMIECAILLKEATPFVQLLGRASRYKRLPSVAVEEALANAVIHFDASLEQDIIIDFNEESLTITSPGGFIGEDLFDVIVSTCPRNPKTSLLLKRLGYVRLEGSGLRQIKGCYTTSGLMPTIMSGSDSFCIQLPSLDNRQRTNLQETEVVLEYLRCNGSGNIVTISRLLMIQVHKMNLIIDTLESDNKIMVMGLRSERTLFYLRPSTEEREDSILQRPGIRSSAGMPDCICC